jgi:hypothetical protein
MRGGPEESRNRGDFMTIQRNWTQLVALCGLTLGALAVHGYHPAVEDAEIYLPGILKQLEPSLFPFNSEFFASHAGMTLFPQVMAASIRLMRVQVGIGMLMWHVVSIFLTLWACLRIAQVCFADRHAVWCGVVLVAALLTIPVAGTSLYLIDQYVTARTVSTPLSLLAVACAIEGRFLSSAAWIVTMAFVHPLMTVFTLAYLVFLLVYQRAGATVSWMAAVPSLLPLGLFEPATPAYQRILETRPLHLITNWRWYEWTGVFAPLLLLLWFSHLAERRHLRAMGSACRSLIGFQVVFCIAALIISRPGRFAQLSELQPMRSLHLLYFLLFLFIGGWLGKALLRKEAWRWVLVFAPLCFGMWFAQRQLFPASHHLEWPWTSSSNPWVEAFDWIRVNTPTDAYFALDPHHMAIPGQDQHGFRAIAQRSMLADAVKDSGAASMFPRLAETWATQVDAQAGWKEIDRSGFQQLKDRFGVTWVVLERPGVPGLSCPYSNRLLLVCRIG